MLKSTFPPRMFMALVLAMLAAPVALAVTFNVNSTVDLPDVNPTSGTCLTSAGTCTLRAAVMQANHASAPSAFIVLPAGLYNLTRPIAGADGDDNGDLNLTAPSNGTTTITITGAGAGTTIIDANQNDRVFHVHAGRTATISGVTIRNGYIAGESGGGIFNGGSLTVDNSTVSGNQASIGGGGIINSSILTVTNSTIVGNTGETGGGLFSSGTLTVTNSTIVGNTASQFGGGLYGSGTLTVTNSTLSQNIAGGDGGGIRNDGNLIVINSTISLNSANNNGGGIYNAGTANIYNTTIVGNDADADRDGGSGGGVFNGGVFNMRNSLLAGNIVANSPQSDDCTGTLTVYGRDLFGDVTGCTINFGTGGAWALYGSLSTLGQLQNNGGPTQTVALLVGSKAIDFGDPAGCTDYNGATIPTDQRGAPRAVGFACDIGAFEYSAVQSPALVSTASRKVHGGAGTFDLPLGNVVTNPTTEPRQGPTQKIVFTFDKPISSAIVTTIEGIATAGPPTYSGNNVIVDLSGVNNQQYVTIALTSVASTDGGTGGSGSIRIGFLLGDVNQNRVVTVSDLSLVNAQLAQPVTAANYLKDVNANGTLTVSDKSITNTNLSKSLPAP